MNGNFLLKKKYRGSLYKRLAHVFVAILTLMALFSCPFSENREIVVRLPEISDTALPADRYHYTLIWGDNRRRITDEREVRVTVTPGYVVPFLLEGYPAENPDFLLKPAGAIYPDDIQNGYLELTWEKGFIALLLHPIRDRVWLFNRERLREKITDVAIKGYLDRTDPWSLDINLLRQKIASGEMRYYYVKRKRTVIITHLPEGRWYTDNPLFPPLVFPASSGELDEGTGSVQKLYYGFHRLWNRDNSSSPSYCAIEVSDKGVILFDDDDQ